MANAMLRRSLAPIAVAAVLGAAGYAQAGNYMGTYDPVDFTGSYLVHIDENCLSANGGTGWIPNNGACGSMYFINAFVTVQANTTPPDAFFPAGGSLNFDLSGNQAQGTAALLGILISNFEFQSPDTTLIHFTSSSPPTSDDWWIQFTSGTPCVPGGDSGHPACQKTPANPPGSALYTTTPFCTNCDFTDSAFAPLALPPGNALLFNGSIPEPGTLGLLLGALGTGWVARRRKRPAD